MSRYFILHMNIPAGEEVSGSYIQNPLETGTVMAMAALGDWKRFFKDLYVSW